jgi:hypothetical protein
LLLFENHCQHKVGIDFVVDLEEVVLIAVEGGTPFGNAPPEQGTGNGGRKKVAVGNHSHTNKEEKGDSHPSLRAYHRPSEIDLEIAVEISPAYDVEVACHEGGNPTVGWDLAVVGWGRNGVVLDGDCNYSLAHRGDGLENVLFEVVRTETGGGGGGGGGETGPVRDE